MEVGFNELPDEAIARKILPVMRGNSHMTPFVRQGLKYQLLYQNISLHYTLVNYKD
jgi:hypothetical protein